MNLKATYTAAAFSIFTGISALAATVTINNGTTGTVLNQLDYHGSWNDNAGFKQSQTKDDSIVLKFHGTKVKVYCGKGHFDGIGAISFDGGNEAEFSTSTMGGQDGGTLVYTSPQMANADHKMKLRTTGKTFGYPAQDFFIQFDKIEVSDDAGTAEAPIPAMPVITSIASDKIYAGEINDYYLTLDWKTNSVGKNLFTWTQDGAYSSYMINFGSTSPTSVAFYARVPTDVFSSAAGGTIEMHQNAVSGPLIATTEIKNNNKDEWKSYTANVSGSVTGIKKVYLVFKQAQGNAGLFDLDWFQFAPTTIVGIKRVEGKNILTNPGIRIDSKGFVQIQNSSETVPKFISILGAQILPNIHR